MKKTLLFAAAALIGFSASAEKHLFAQDRSGWTITGCSQRNGYPGSSDGGYAQLVDGNTTTFWHSQYSAQNHPDEAPHYLVIDRGENAGTIEGFGFQPRTDLGSDNSGNGYVVAYKIYVTDNIEGLATAGSYSATAATSGAASTTDSHASINTFMDANTATKEGAFSILRNDASTHVLQQVQFDEAVSGQYVVFVMTEVQSKQTGKHAHCAEFYLYDFREPTAADIAAAKAELQSACTTATSNLSEYFKDNIPGYYPVNSDQQVEMENKIAEFSALSAADADATWEQLQEAKASVGNLTLSSNTDLSVANGIYKLVNPNGRGYIYDAERDDAHVMVSSQTSGNFGANPAGFSAEHAYWSVVNVDGNYYIYNVATKKFLVAPASQGVGQYWTLSAENASPMSLTASPAGYGKVEILGNSNIHLSLTGTYQDRTWVVSYYAENDDGVPFVFERVADDNVTLDNEMAEQYRNAVVINAAKTAANNAITVANRYTGSGDDLRIGEGLNLYTGTDVATLNSLIAALQATMNGTDADAITAATEALNNEVAKLTMNMPAAGAFYRIRSTQQGMRYLASHNTDHPDYQTARGNLVHKAGNENATIFFYNGNSLLGYETGYYLKNISNFAGFIFDDSQAASNTATSVEIGDATSTSVGTYFVKFNGSRYLSAKSSNKTVDEATTTYYHTDAGGVYNMVGYTWWLESVNALPVTIDETGYAAFCAPVALTLPNSDIDVKAYVISAKKGNQLTLTLIDNEVIAPNTPMIVMCQTPGTYNFPISTEAAVVNREAATPLLAASAHTTVMPEGAYTLQQKDGQIGMYPAAEGAALKGFSAYMPASAAAGQEGYTLVADGSTTTSISEIVAEGAASNGAVFDLQGRRVSKASKGIFIINGKKTLVK